MESLKNENVFKHQPQNYYYFLFHTFLNKKPLCEWRKERHSIFFCRNERKKYIKTMLDNNHDMRRGHEREIGYVYVIVCFMSIL